MSRKRWVQKPLDDEHLIDDLSRELNDLPLPLARALVLRGITSFDDAKSWFRDAMDRLPDPFLMADMEAAVERVLKAIDGNEKIVVYGDYDVDGTSATALLTGFFRRAGAEVDFFVPHRFQHGYGLSMDGLDHVREHMEPDLIVAVDCGVTAIDEVAHAATHGIDLIICDHHTPLDTLPDAVAVLDPKRADCNYPFRELCGCGVAFKLAQAVHSRRNGHYGDGAAGGAAGGNDSHETLDEYLDLVAVATASDLVSLTGENRILVREGLRRLQQGRRIGLVKLAEEANIKLSTCSSSSLVYTLSPRINAAGRMDHAGSAVDLMLTTDEVQARAKAYSLEKLNQRRRDEDQKTQEQAAKKASALLAGEPRSSIVLYDPEWHLGVIGIVASRLVDAFYRPTVLLGSSDGIAKGSARSIEGVSIYDAIKSCEDLLIDFGGHHAAAGLSIRPEDIPEFSHRLDEAVSEQISDEILEPSVEYDASMAIGDLTKKFWAVLKQFAPFGADNPAPIFHAGDLRVTGPISTVGRDRSHLKFKVSDARGEATPRDVIGFRMSKRYLDLVTKSQAEDLPLEMLFQIQENVWNGRTSLQLKARDIRLQSDFF